MTILKFKDGKKAEFDNVHFERDNPNVPSDLEQMPNLLNFIRDNGTLLTNDHTVLISHTANGILTDFTGLYSDRHGQSVANSALIASSAFALTMPGAYSSASQM